MRFRGRTGKLKSMSNPLPRIAVNGEVIPPEAIAFELSRLAQFYSRHMAEEQVRQQLPELRARADAPA